MIKVQVRKQGGAAIMTIPADVLKVLNVKVGSTLALAVNNNALTVTPQNAVRSRYSLDELLAGVTQAKVRAMKKIARETQTGPSIGREMP